MADHGHSSGPVVHGIEAHRATYEGFLNWSIAGALVVFYICVALVDFRFVDFPLNMFLGFGGMIIGILFSLIGLRLGGKWTLPVVALVLNGLLVGMLVHMS